jgi:hypothetical protein
MDLGEHKVILGYSWFAAVQPKIDWKNGWINSLHLPIILWMDNVGKAKYMARHINVPWLVYQEQYYLGKVTIGQATTDKLKGVLEEYKWHSKVLPRHLLLLTQAEIEEVRKFIKEHLKQNTIWLLWSPYAANFFFVKKKDGKLWPV